MYSPTITFGDMKKQIKAELFPDLLADNLVIPVNRLFIEAIVDLQTFIPELQVNNTEIIPFCATYFNCGMTVFQAPRGVIYRVRTYDRLDSNWRENKDVVVNWCAPVDYVRGPYEKLRPFVDKSMRCSRFGLDNVVQAVMGPWVGKRITDAYPAPTDEDYHNFPELPLGFHWPQASTDSGYGRARSGVWALNHDRIYMAPWLNSTEVVVIEWDGLKRQWADSDLLEDDPLLLRAIKHFVAWGFYRDYDRDQEQAELHKEEFLGAPGIIGARPMLAHQFREETRPREERHSFSRMSSKTLHEQSTGIILPIVTTTTTPAYDPCNQPPTAATNVAVITLPAEARYVTWIPGNYDTTQEVLRSLDGGVTYDRVFRVPVAVSSYRDEDPQTGTICYKIRGSNSCGFYSPLSAAACCSCLTPTAPVINSVNLLSGVIHLNWTPGNGNDDQFIFRSIDGGEAVQVGTVPFDAVTFGDSDTETLGNYCYTVMGRNTCGTNNSSSLMCVLLGIPL